MENPCRVPYLPVLSERVRRILKKYKIIPLLIDKTLLSNISSAPILKISIRTIKTVFQELNMNVTGNVLVRQNDL